MRTDYKKLEKMYAINDSTDRVNRGVKLKGWIIAFLFSVLFYGLFFVVYYFK